MTLQRYMQPVAVHGAHPERLLLADEDARWFLWMGESGLGPIEISRELAAYLLDLPVMWVLEASQRMWFVVDDLPVRAPLGLPIGREFTA